METKGRYAAGGKLLGSYEDDITDEGLACVKRKSNSEILTAVQGE